MNQKFISIVSTIKKIGIWLYLLMLLVTYADQFINRKMEAGLTSAVGLDKSIWVYGIASLFLAILFPLLIIFLVLYGIKDSEGQTPGAYRNYFKKYFSSLCIETLRSWGKVLSWSFLLIIPGFYKYFSFIFVPFVVIFSEKYEVNNLDALDESSRVFRKNWFSLSAVIMFFYLFVPFVLTQVFDEYRVLVKTPVAAALLVVLDAFISIVAIHVLYKIYLKSTREPIL